MAIQDYFLGKVKQGMENPGPVLTSDPLLRTDAAFLQPFFNMPTQNTQQMMRQGTATPQPATQTPTATQAPTASRAAQPSAVPTAPTPTEPTRSFSAATAKEFKDLYGRNPLGQELMDFVAGTYDPNKGGVEKSFGVDTSQTEKDIFSTFGINQNDPNAMYDKFGLEQPDFQAPDSQEYKDLVAEQKSLADIDRREQLKKQYELDVERISGEYNIKREQLSRDVQNSKTERISSLYDVGVVNPLSSGLASIGTASKEYEDRQMGLLAQQEATEKQLAYANYFDLETKEIERRLDSINSAITAENENAQAEYQQQVEAFDRGVQLIDKFISVWKEGNRVSEKERADAQGAFNDLVKNFGSAAFNGMDSENLAEMEAALGYPAGSLQSGITQLKKDELRDKPMDLRTIGGALYNIARDAEGNIVPTLIIAKPAGSGVGGSSVSDKQLKAMFNEADSLRKELADGDLEWGQAYNRIARQYPELAVPDANGSTIIDDALGGSGGYDPATGTFDSSKATGFAKPGNDEYTLTPEQINKYYSAAYDYDKKKLDTSKIPDNVRNEVIERYGEGAEPEKKGGGLIGRLFN